MTEYSEKIKTYWCNYYPNTLKISKSEAYIVFRKITWVNPTESFVKDMQERFKFTKALSYSEKNGRLYLYSQERKVVKKESCKGEMEILYQKGRIIRDKKRGEHENFISKC